MVEPVVHTARVEHVATLELTSVIPGSNFVKANWANVRVDYAVGDTIQCVAATPVTRESGCDALHIYKQRRACL